MVPQMMGITDDGRQGQWVLHGIALQTLGHQTMGATDNMAPCDGAVDGGVNDNLFAPTL